ncbi:hypothetical protein fugu_006156 [Takifugu bimaculatus]|uniref:Hydroxylysine kinase n=1 Tax=Takifugu bimaculatus TaxID=433685 RepID=A0A4Z2B7B1_9TELE|nr:hypothetical protein fugu_006156 [Takifugu bimaculatus]
MDQSTYARPTLSLQQATDLVEQLYGMRVTKMTNLPSYLDQNFRLEGKDGKRYVLKIMNVEDSKNSSLLEMQTLAMSFLKQHGLPAQTVIPTTTGKLMSMEEIDCGHGVQTYCVRLMNYIAGKTIAETPVTQKDLYEVGKLAATVDKTLQTMDSPNIEVLQKGDSVWSLSNIPLLEEYLSVMEDDPLKDVVQAVIDKFKTDVQPKLNFFRKGVIHGDLRHHNIIVKPDDSGNNEVSGILDFSLLMNGCFVYELAISIAYFMLENPSPLDAGGALVAGWESIMHLNQEEKDSLFLLVLGRLCQSLVLGRYNAQKYPDNKYLLKTTKGGTELLTKLMEMGKEEVQQKWFAAERAVKAN